MPTLKANIDQLGADAALFHAMLAGGPTETVDVAGVPRPTVAKAIADACAPYSDGPAIAGAAEASATAAAASASVAALAASGGLLTATATGVAVAGTMATRLSVAGGGARVGCGSAEVVVASGASADGFGPSYDFYKYEAGVGRQMGYIAAVRNTYVDYADVVIGALYGGATAVERLRCGMVGVTVSGGLQPSSDNDKANGSAAARWSVVYAGTGTINTSDAREKTAVAAMTAAEVAASRDLAAEIGTYRFLAAVAEKGDAARMHVGMTVQRAIAIMEGHGLNPFAYGCICFDQWEDRFVEHPAIEARDAVLDDAGNIVEPAVEPRAAYTEQVQHAGDRYSFRPDELLLFIARGFDARLAALEAV